MTVPNLYIVELRYWTDGDGSSYVGKKVAVSAFSAADVVVQCRYDYPGCAVHRIIPESVYIAETIREICR